MRQHRVRRYLHSVEKPVEENVPNGVLRVAWSRAIRWFGWGFGESLIPIVIIGFSNSYATAGFVQSSFEIVMLLMLPFVGAFLDRSRARTAIIIALLVYPFVGLSYFLAGVLGIAAFVLVAKVVGGFAYAIDGLAVDTYYRRMVPSGNLSSAFGYIDSLANIGWIAAGLIGMFLVGYMPPQYLLLLIAPTSLIALLVVLRAPRDVPVPQKVRSSLTGVYGAAFRDIASWNTLLRLLALLAFFMAVVETLITFFIPIDAYMEGASPALVILLGIIATIPYTFGFALGRFVEHRNPRRILAYGLFSIGILVLLLALFPQFAFKMLASFILGVIIETFIIVSKKMLTSMSLPNEYGERGSTFESIGVLGNLAGPLLLGVSLDMLGFSGTAIWITVFAFIVGIGFMVLRARHWEIIPAAPSTVS